VCLVVPGLQRPAVEADALDQVVAAVVEERDARVDVRDPVQRREVLGREGLAEDRRAEEEVQEAPVRDAEDALVGEPLLQAVLDAVDARDDLGERLRTRLGMFGRVVRHPADVAGSLVVRGGGAVGVGLTDLEQVVIRLVREAEDLADPLRGLLRAAERRGDDRLDSLVLQALAQAAQGKPS